MIANRIGLVVATLIALALGIVVVVDGRRSGTPSSRALVTDFDTDKIARLAWSRGGEPAVVLERAGTTWRWTKPIADIPANPATIDAVLAALRGGRWHRIGPIANAGILRVALTATAADRKLEIGVGDALEGAAQTWLAIGDRAFLVDDWVARALSPEPLALRETRPLRDAASANTIVVDRVIPSQFAFRLEGTPRKMVRPIDLLMNPFLVTALHQALSQLSIVGLPTTVGGAAFVTMTITIDAPRLITLELRSEGCPAATVAISGTFGPACVASADWATAAAAIERFRMASTDLADPQPLRIDPIKITLPDGGVLDLEKRAKIGDRDADPVRVTELLAVLQLSRSIENSDPAIQPIGTLVAVDHAGTTITLDLLPNKRIRRRGESVALVLGAGAWEIVTRPSAALRDPTLWTEDELTIRSITIDQMTHTRGAVVGEWTPPANNLDELARILAKLRATDAPRPPARILHTITFETAPPTGTPVTRTIQLGAGCVAVIDTKPFQLEPRTCNIALEVKP